MCNGQSLRFSCSLRFKRETARLRSRVERGGAQSLSKLALGLLVAGIAAMPFVDKTDATSQPVLAYGDDIAQTQHSPKQIAYIVTSHLGLSCRIVGELGQVEIAVVKPDPSCATVMAGLENVSRWTAGASGFDLLQDASGKTILVIGPSDGFAYEATTEDGTQLSFALSDV
jgi:hypothetical protein